MKRFLILGGYGNTGILIARLLVKHTDSQVALAGRSKERGTEVAYRLNQRYSTLRVTSVVCDAGDRTSLLAALKNCDFVIVASSTSRYVETIAKAAIESGVDYLDVQVSASKVRYLKSIQHRILESGRTFITDAGFHPGLPALMARYAGSCFDEMNKANIGSLIYINWAQYNFSESTFMEFVEEFKSYSNMVYKDKKWQKVKMSDKLMMKQFDFKEPFGKMNAYSMYLDEMSELTEKYPALDETGFYIQGFNWFTNYLVFPFAAVSLKLFPSSTKFVGKIFGWSVRKFSKPPFRCILKLEAEGLRDGKTKKMEIVISHEDGYFLTAIPIAATLMQYIEGLVKPGLHFMAHYPEPLKLISDMKYMGLDITITE
jgi:saccharopine dehydrogenase-like NADP-dependent oxidoreductase